jgi:hypothetical protein
LRGSAGFAATSAAMPTLDILVDTIFAGSGQYHARPRMKFFWRRLDRLAFPRGRRLREGARALFFHNFCFCSPGQATRKGNPSPSALYGFGYFNFMREEPVRLV